MQRHKTDWLLLLVAVFAAAVMCTGCGANAFDAASPAWVQVPIDSAAMSALQTEFDGGHRVGLRDPVQVTYEFLEYELAIPGSTVSNVQDKKQRNGQCDVTGSLQDGRTIQLVLVQPVRTDSTGIWCVQNYRFLTKP
jgi:hypothetical protein